MQRVLINKLGKKGFHKPAGKLSGKEVHNRERGRAGQGRSEQVIRLVVGYLDRLDDEVVG